MRGLLGRGFLAAEVTRLDRAIDRALGLPMAHRLGDAGRALIRKWEGCARRRADGCFEAYPDPGSADGTPWTIGWGSTGPDIARGTVWTQAQCDARFDRDIETYAAQVASAIADAPTTQSQFDALVSFHYNTGAIAAATLTRKHKAGDYDGAAAEFGRWIHNEGKVLPGLVKRRAEEAALYRR